MSRANLYAELRSILWRSRPRTDHRVAIVQEAASHYVPVPVSERLVQCIWYDQRIVPDRLLATDGKPIQVIFQGWWNRERGPDFSHATIRHGDQPERTGAVEIHLRADDWFHHGHHRDPVYNKVILHVALWEDGRQRSPVTADGREIPQLILEQCLDGSLEDLHDEIDVDAYPFNVRDHGGHCVRPIAQMTRDQARSLLEQAGEERYAAKTRRFVRWIHRAGQAQAFYQAWMEAFGYKSNKRAFRLLARRLPLAELDARPSDIAALMFGVANLLPVTASRDPFIRRLWHRWWKIRPDYLERVLPRDTWQRGGVRPANHPHRRLGTAAALVRKHPNLFDNVIGALETGGDPATLFTAVRDPYWNNHFTLGGKRAAAPVQLVGPARAQELMVNVVLPFAAAHAAITDNPGLAERCLDRYRTLGRSSSNATLRLAAQQLFDSQAAARRVIRTACQQQGLLQVFHDFCLQDKSGCEQCQFPALASHWGHGSPATADR